MTEWRFYWDAVASEIEKLNKKGIYGHPRKWKPKVAKDFLEVVVSGAKKNLLRNKTWFNSLLPNLKEENQHIDAVTTPNYTTFYRIFQTKNEKEISDGSEYTRNLFAVYLGSKSYLEYVTENELWDFFKVLPLPPYLVSQSFDSPYLGLRTYSTNESELFYGRGAELIKLTKYLYEIPDAPDDNRQFKDVLLLHGNTGVGKSSLLHAGLLPRMTRDWDVFYQRRDDQKGILSVFDSLDQNFPIVIVLDQIHQLKKSKLSQKYATKFFSGIIKQVKESSTEAKVYLLGANVDSLDEITHQFEKLKYRDKISVLKKKELTKKEYLDLICGEISSNGSSILLCEYLGDQHNLIQELLSHGLPSPWWRYDFIREEGLPLQLLERISRKRKRLVILDQMEEAIIKPLSTFSPLKEHPKLNPEIGRMASQIKARITIGQNYKFVLSFRAEYLAEIQDALATILPNNHENWLLHPMGAEGIMEAISGPLQSGYFNLKYYEGFEKELSYLLAKDKESNIAPALQIILKKLWETVKKGDRFISRNLFEREVGTKGKILEQFVAESLCAISDKHPKGN